MKFVIHVHNKITCIKHYKNILFPIADRPWFEGQLDANLWSVDGETDCRDSLLTNSMQNIGE